MDHDPEAAARARRRVSAMLQSKKPEPTLGKNKALLFMAKGAPLVQMHTPRGVAHFVPPTAVSMMISPRRSKIGQMYAVRRTGFSRAWIKLGAC